MQQPVPLSPKFRAHSSHIFTQSPENITVVCGIDCLVCQDEFCMNNFLNVEDDDYDLDLALHPSRLFRFALNRACHSNNGARLMHSSPNACLMIARVSIALFPRFDAQACLENMGALTRWATTAYYRNSFILSN
jgi:hypothetical protein